MNRYKLLDTALIPGDGGELHWKAGLSPGATTRSAGVVRRALDDVPLGFAATAWLARRGAGYGLCQVYRNELWHFELRPGGQLLFASHEGQPVLTRGRGELTEPRAQDEAALQVTADQPVVLEGHRESAPGFGWPAGPSVRSRSWSNALPLSQMELAPRTSPVAGEREPGMPTPTCSARIRMTVLQV